MVIESFAVKLPSQMNETVYQLVFNNLPNHQKEKIRRYRVENDVHRSLIGQCLIRVNLCKMVQCANSELEFIYNSFGKPSLRSKSPIEFNLSHSGEWVVASIANKPVGIDIEYIQNDLDYDLYTKDFFSKEEYELLQVASQKEIPGQFFELWTLKESFLKSVGVGLSWPLKSFTISKNRDSINITDSKGNRLNHNFIQYNIDRDYKLAVCSSEANFTKEMKIIDYQELIDSFYSVSETTILRYKE